MFFRKTVTGIAALAAIVNMSGITAFADDANGNSYREAKLETLVHSYDNVQTIDCRYYDSMPSIPYIRLSDYYRLWTDQEIVIEDAGDGIYELMVPIGVTGFIDTDEDIIHSDFLDYLFAIEAELLAEDPTSDLYIKWRTTGSGDGQPITEADIAAGLYAYEIDLGKYNIDIIAGDDDVWFPVPTLCDVFLSESGIPFYMDDKLIFGNTTYSGFSITELPYTQEHSDYIISKYSENGRPQDLIDYNYNELCFFFDHSYAYPGRPYYTELIREKGLDGMLSEANDSTRKIKELLLSSDYIEYGAGLNLINAYLWDGGHTVFTETASSANENFLKKIKDKITELDIQTENGVDYRADYNLKLDTYDYAEAARDEMIKTADYKEEVEGTELSSGYIYCEKGDTAFFSFDFFDTDFYAWNDYYHNNGEMPSEVVSYFYKCLLRADENPEIKKFVIDMGTNGGGFDMVCYYILGVISDFDLSRMYLPSEDYIYDFAFDVDKNFDGVIDEKDKNFSPDLKYGVITSNYSFSNASYFPTIAHEKGIALIGEKTGGGACAVTKRLTPDGNVISFSSGICGVDSEGKSVDLGVEPDFENVILNDDGTKDFSATYNFDNISKCLDEFYGTGTTETCLFGDANCDNNVDISDAVIIMQSLSNPSKYQLTTKGRANGDVYSRGDGITNADALSIQKYMLQLIDKLPES